MTIGEHSAALRVPSLLAVLFPHPILFRVFIYRSRYYITRYCEETKRKDHTPPRSTCTMSTSPTPSAAEDPEWRLSFRQPQRNAQVLQIASELAGLEPGATANSKKRIAMQFEDLVFREATSAQDYQKRITKRLKKLKKNYRPPEKAEGAGTEEELAALLQQHSKDMEYIVRNAATAAREMRKNEKFKDTASYLEGRVKSWTRELGIGQKNNKSIPVPNAKRLQEIKSELNSRVSWLRSCVAKFVDPNEFLLTSLRKMESDFKNKKKAAETQALVLQSFVSSQPLASSPAVDTALAQAMRTVPPTMPAKAAAQIHLDKMRSASHVVLGYMMTKDKSTVTDPRTLEKVYQEVVNTSLEPVLSVMKEVRQQEAKTTAGIQLSDAWLKQLPENNPEAGLQIRSQLLLIPGRKPAPSFVSALESKGGRLVRPPPTGAGSHAIVDFAPGFTMTIYFVPLLVTLRAFQKKETSTRDESSKTNQSTNLPQPGCATLTPLHVGLEEKGDELCIGPNIAVGNFASVGQAIQERLDDASTAATQVLRRIFSTKVAAASSDFEKEVVEASALLEFVQLARDTYG